MVLVGVAATRVHSYLLFHSLAEFFWIAVALTTFSIAWNTRHHLDNTFLMVSGISLGPVAFIGLLHSLAYKGMGVFPSTTADANMATQLWIASRSLDAASILAAAMLGGRKVSSRWVLIGSTAAAALLTVLVFTGLFPDCFVEGQGLTTFKVVAEYVIMAIFGIVLLRLRQIRDLFPEHLYRLMMVATALALAEEAAFTLYRDVYGLLNLGGHLVAVVYGYVIYAGIVRYGLANPEKTLFHQLNTLNERLADKSLRDNERAALALEAVGGAAWEWTISQPRPPLSPRHQAWLMAPAGKPVTAEAWRERVPAEDRDAFDGLMVARPPGEALSAEYRLRRPDGTTAWFATTTRTFASTDGVLMIGLDLDISARKESEAERSRLTEEVRKFAEILAHHLQEPARLQACYAQVLRRKLNGSLAPEAEEALGVIEASAETLRRLLRDAHLYMVLDRLPPPANPADADLALHSAWARLISADTAAAQLDAEPLPPVPLTQERATDLFVILLGNALQYRHPDRAPAVTVRSRQVDGELVLTLEDNGIGIADRYVEKVFLPFERLHTQAAYPGSGVGLALAKKIVEGAGGRIWITSELGRGTVVHIALPTEGAHE
ncbi:MAG: MASE3 domain-containing protein [Solirubrobacterales bacterium]